MQQSWSNFGHNYGSINYESGLLSPALVTYLNFVDLDSNLQVFDFIVNVVHNDVDFDNILVGQIGQNSFDVGGNVARRVVAFRVVFVTSKTSIRCDVMIVVVVVNIFDELLIQTTTSDGVLLDKSTL